MRTAAAALALALSATVAQADETWTAAVLAAPTATTPPSAGDMLALIQGGATKKLAWSNVNSFPITGSSGGIFNFNGGSLLQYTINETVPIQIGYGAGTASADFLQIYDPNDTLSFGTIVDGGGIATENLWNNTHFSGVITAQSTIAFNVSHGTVAAPTTCKNADLGGIGFREHFNGTSLATGWSDDAANIHLNATEDCATNHNGTSITMQVTALAAAYSSRTTMFTLTSNGLGIGMAPNTVSEISSNAALGAYGAAGSFTSTAASIIDFASGTNEMRLVSAGPSAAKISMWIGNTTAASLTTALFSMPAANVSALTFGTLPSAAAGDVAYITDALAGNCADGTCTTFGTNVTGGTGALKKLVWYNGAHWTLIGN